jgi:hypothetical protein
VGCPDQVWVADTLAPAASARVIYIRLRKEFSYLAVLTLAPPARTGVDLFTRQIRGWELSRNLDGQLTPPFLNGHGQNHGSRLQCEQKVRATPGNSSTSQVNRSASPSFNPCSKGARDMSLADGRIRSISLGKHTTFVESQQGTFRQTKQGSNPLH